MGRRTEIGGVGWGKGREKERIKEDMGEYDELEGIKRLCAKGIMKEENGR